MLKYPSYKWNDISCTTKRSYICKRSSSSMSESGCQWHHSLCYVITYLLPILIKFWCESSGNTWGSWSLLDLHSVVGIPHTIYLRSWYYYSNCTSELIPWRYANLWLVPALYDADNLQKWVVIICRCCIFVVEIDNQCQPKQFCSFTHITAIIMYFKYGWPTCSVVLPSVCQ